MKPFFRFEVTRYHGVAMVTVYKVRPKVEGFDQTVVSQYETASVGATSSARKEIKKLQKAEQQAA